MDDVIRIETGGKKAVVDLTGHIESVLKKFKVHSGLCAVFVKHTTAALTSGEIGEGTEKDFLDIVEKLIPRIQFRHAHDPSHAWSHMAASLIGPSVTIPVSEGSLVLGTWQAIMLVELDGPRERQVHVSVVPGS
ncbi:hypothetical protein YTPLAS18_15000 [Nitrospira sp.]|nr:hypothetical protein YTPLAS18_15000 [Nitrospira sp.]